jgi:hypothetical protein
MSTEELARILILLGFLVIASGLILLALGRFPVIGNLPGDLHLQSDGVSCFVPLASMLVVSVILSILLTIVVNLLQRH